MGNKTLELRPASVDKATVARTIIKQFTGLVDSIMCIGDGKTDEVVFSYLKEVPNSVCVTVGKKRTEAAYYLENVKDVENFLQGFAAKL